MSESAESCRQISIFDTTLRDGEQAPGNTMSAGQKLKVALALEAVGVDVIEAGFPASSPSDFEATRLLSKHLTSSGFCSFARACEEDIAAAIDAGGTEANHQVQILATASELHLEHKRGISRDEAVRELLDAARYARDRGAQNISIALEDSSRASDELLEELCFTAAETGASTVVVCDTSGSQIPGEFAGLVGKIRRWLPEEVQVSTHCHDDMGLAVANAIAGVRAGADQVQSTLAGIGERAGNTAVEEFVAVLAYKGDLLGLRTGIRSELLIDAFGALRDSVGLVVGRNKAVFGANAFSTEAGIHQAAILRNPETYEYLRPESFGRRRSLFIGRHSGRAIIKSLLDELGVEADSGLIDRFYREFVADRSDSEFEELDAIKKKIDVLLTSRSA